MQFAKTGTALAVAFALSATAYADEDAQVTRITITGGVPQQAADPLAAARLNCSDSAALLADLPGVSLYRAGGVSSLPVLHGMADDRVRVKVDGMDLISACANHMNPPLSYIDPSNVADVEVLAGITPVSVGGDSIAGTVLVRSPAPEFAQPGSLLSKGQIGSFYRSNNSAQGFHASATLASDTLSMRYAGSTVRAGDYKAAQAFKSPALIAGSLTGTAVAGDTVGSSSYQSENQQLAFAMRRDNHLLELQLGLQNIPYQGFPNQRMDMTGNDSQQINLHYQGQYRWGMLEARAYNEHTRHSMNFLGDKQYWYGTLFNVAGMPMYTDGKNSGLQLKGDVLLGARDILHVGAEYQRYRLNDWWTPVANSAMMSPNVFQNINNGQRDRFDVFADWEAHWNPQWTSRLGVRSDTVKMNAGNVQGYSTAYTAAATAFNALDHQRSDHNLDASALASYIPDATHTFEAGYAMKARSPNLYERFAWSNSNTMVMNMNNWYGDGNGYVGNINLRPEVAHTLSVSGSWHDAAQQQWELKVAPYYTRVQDYIDAVSCAAAGISCPARTDGFVNLTLANQSARLYGADVSGRLALAQHGDYGSLTASGVLSYVNGKNLSSSGNLYNIMPLNAKLALEQRLGNWSNTLQWQLVGAKTRTEAVRQELRSGGYGLLNLYSSYAWKQARIDFGIDNLFNKFYYDPLGGAYVGQGATMGTGVPYGSGVPGMGRSLNVGMTVKF
jgi:iron complex outermembrane receptor protein